MEVFRYPDDFSRFLETSLPTVACFSSYVWNARLGYAFAEKIKQVSPQTVTIFGGPNYPDEPEAQREFLRRRPAIDYFVQGEGEESCARLLECLETVAFDATALKASGAALEGVHYLSSRGELIGGPLPQRMAELDITPSPYLTGLADKFFDSFLTPIIETTRGCPFQCTYCQQGTSYFNKVRRIDQRRVEAEIDYILDRVKVPDLVISDSNFGMYTEDLETGRLLASRMKSKGWPKFVLNQSGKNRKDRLMELVEILDGRLVVTVSVQTTDPDILVNIKRKNISIDQIIDAGKFSENYGAKSYSEIILCLPGDSKGAHFRSILKMVDADINVIFIWQMMLLYGTEAASRDSRLRFGMDTRYRILPRCFGFYDLFGERLAIAETEEICIANNTMTFDDYLDCRALDLTVEFFYNGSIFAPFARFLLNNGIPVSRFIEVIHSLATAPESPIHDLYAGFLKENRDKLWDSESELWLFLEDPKVIERLIAGKLGSNELYKYRAISIFERQKDLHDVVKTASCMLLRDKCIDTAHYVDYINELSDFSLRCRQELFNSDLVTTGTYSYDFIELDRARYVGDPGAYRLTQPRQIRIFHSDDQKARIASSKKAFGTSLDGLARMLIQTHISTLYRKAEWC